MILHTILALYDLDSSLIYYMNLAERRQRSRCGLAEGLQRNNFTIPNQGGRRGWETLAYHRYNVPVKKRTLTNAETLPNNHRWLKKIILQARIQQTSKTLQSTEMSTQTP